VLEDAAEKAIRHYELAGWSPSTSLSALMNALYYGPRRVGEAIGRCEQLLHEHAGDRASEANLLQWLGGLQGMSGRFEEARANIRSATEIYESLGLPLAARDGCALVLADVEELAGRTELAEGYLRQACQTCIELNEGSLLASRTAQLADVLYALGQYEEATEWVETSRQRADEEDLHAQASWRGVAARLAAQRGELETAFRLIDEAVAIVGQGDGLNQRAKSQLELGEVLTLASRDTASVEAVNRAVELYEEKENEVAARHARALLGTSAFV
jgi:tetratricopeptide (TPR) repeat protein